MTHPAPTPRIRVAAVIVEVGQVLLVRHQKDGQSYWMLPGGGVDPGETLTQALQRELREELRVEASIGSLLLVSDAIPPDRHRHIVNICFRASLTHGVPVRGDDPRIVEVAYHPLDRLDTVSFRPDFVPDLRRALADKQEGARYLGNIWRD